MPVALIGGCAALVVWTALFPDIGPTADRVHCKEQCEAIWESIQHFVAEHGDVPRSQAGAFSLEPLGLPPGSIVCPSSNLPYVVLPTLEAAMLNVNEPTHRAVPIVFCPPGSHAHCEKSLVTGFAILRRKTQQMVVLPIILFSNGEVRVWPCRAPLYEHWVENYIHGRGPKRTFPPPLSAEESHFLHHET